MVAYLYLSFCNRSLASSKSWPAALSSLLTNDSACGAGKIFLFSKHFLKARFTDLFFPEGEAVRYFTEKFRVCFFLVYPFDLSLNNGTNIDLNISQKIIKLT